MDGNSLMTMTTTKPPRTQKWCRDPPPRGKVLQSGAYTTRLARWAAPASPNRDQEFENQNQCCGLQH